MTIVYRRISRLPTCIGNERIRVAGDGEVSHSRNTAECEEGSAGWSAPWRAVGRLDAAAIARLEQQVAGTGVLELESESIDESAEGGTREEMDLAIGERDRHVVVENTDVPA